MCAQGGYGYACVCSQGKEMCVEGWLVTELGSNFAFVDPLLFSLACERWREITFKFLSVFRLNTALKNALYTVLN